MSADAPKVATGDKRQLVAQLRSAMHRLTGRDYRIHSEELDAGSLRELLRFVRDVDSERTIAINRARINPWRRG
jgi:hypothetical protein